MNSILEVIDNTGLNGGALAHTAFPPAVLREPSPYPWYAIYVRPRYEVLVTEHLRGSGYEVFLPTYRQVRRWSDRTVELDAPLFPAYTFSRFDVKQRLPILQTNGVIQILGRGKHPLSLPDAEIEAVRRLLEANPDTRPCPFLKKGARVRVRRGPLAGLEGILTRRKGRHQLVLSVTMLERSVAAEVHLADVDPV